MSRTLLVLSGLLAGYALGALVGAGLIEVLSTYRHDKSLGAVMTGAFVTGPIGALLGAIAGGIWRRTNSGST